MWWAKNIHSQHVWLMVVKPQLFMCSRKKCSALLTTSLWSINRGWLMEKWIALSSQWLKWKKRRTRKADQAKIVARSTKSFAITEGVMLWICNALAFLKQTYCLVHMKLFHLIDSELGVSIVLIISSRGFTRISSSSSCSSVFSEGH